MRIVDRENARNALEEMYNIVIVLQTESVRPFTPAERQMTIDALKVKIAIYEAAYQLSEPEAG